MFRRSRLVESRLWRRVTPGLRLLLLACLLVGLAAALPVLAQPVAGAAADLPTPRADAARLDYRLQARPLAPGAWVVEGDNADFSVPNGCNIINTAFFATGAGVVVVNTGTSRRYGEQLRALIARTTPEPVVRVLHLNLHPDYFLGNQAFADVPRAATAATRAGIAREAAAYETNLYRLCGDWMRGTEALAPDQELEAAVRTGVLQVGQRRFELLELQGHTESDLVLFEPQSGVLLAGGLVFVQRVPTTPHAQLGPWRASLARLADWAAPRGVRWLVPSHGPVQALSGGPAVAAATQGTDRYLDWLDRHFSRWAAQGGDMNDVIRAEVPVEFRAWAAFGTEYLRNVAHLYPAYERQVMAPGRPAAR
ncbi:quinoprotein relay system zinc metallohydrolase 1 [Ideonella sp. TBM-1]|uniref:Quinoprotein relay system zinc metallohydrolase 1 n=2 Tax=Ideonella livida TaxID=2707176 RepID=A0A7C9TJ12_9BURK|nr:quinoprotein relay system zinc metallohydrolase 1 [Ideonella livida]